MFLRPLAAREEDVKVTLMEARKNLSKTIAYSDDLARGTSDVYVAVGEADGEVNQDHPGFRAQRPRGVVRVHGKWSHAPAAAGATPAEAAAEVHQLTRLDHGTHVSGIVGARPSSLMPGLTPEVRLFLVDTDGNLTNAIQDAYDADLRIFNFSFAIKPEASDAAELNRRLLQHWTDALFVVAAGNDGINLNAGGSEPFVSWVLEAPNIIGVGASQTDGLTVMGPQPDPAESGKTVPGSNFGSRFVQLVAPGQQIYSLGDEHYAFATGTSQAVPQVTAAAAILSLRMNGPRPLKIKARLIATASWNDGFKDKVWGGLLDVDRAVEHLQRNVVRLQSAPQSVRAITLGDDVKLKIRQATTYPSDGTAGTFVNVQEVFVRKILRLQHLGASVFRIVMVDAADRVTISVRARRRQDRVHRHGAVRHGVRAVRAAPGGYAQPLRRRRHSHAAAPGLRGQGGGDSRTGEVLKEMSMRYIVLAAACLAIVPAPATARQLRVDPEKVLATVGELQTENIEIVPTVAGPGRVFRQAVSKPGTSRLRLARHGG